MLLVPVMIRLGTPLKPRQVKVRNRKSLKRDLEGQIGQENCPNGCEVKNIVGLNSMLKPIGRERQVFF